MYIVLSLLSNAAYAIPFLIMSRWRIILWCVVEKEQNHWSSWQSSNLHQLKIFTLLITKAYKKCILPQQHMHADTCTQIPRQIYDVVQIQIESPSCMHQALIASQKHDRHIHIQSYSYLSLAHSLRSNHDAYCYWGCNLTIPLTEDDFLLQCNLCITGINWIWLAQVQVIALTSEQTSDLCVIP